MLLCVTVRVRPRASVGSRDCSGVVMGLPGYYAGRSSSLFPFSPLSPFSPSYGLSWDATIGTLGSRPLALAYWPFVQEAVEVL